MRIDLGRVALRTVIGSGSQRRRRASSLQMSNRAVTVAPSGSGASSSRYLASSGAWRRSTRFPGLTSSFFARSLVIAPPRDTVIIRQVYAHGKRGVFRDFPVARRCEKMGRMSDDLE